MLSHKTKYLLSSSHWHNSSSLSSYSSSDFLFVNVDYIQKLANYFLQNINKNEL